MERPTNRFPSLDGLRAVSILAVLVGHCAGTRGFVIQTGTPIVFDLAELGVTVFFVISGFLITSLLIREEMDTGRIALRQFYIRRILRIVPAFWLFLVCVATLDRLGMVSVSRTDLLMAITWTENYNFHPAWVTGHIWSLSVEEQFYLIWPLALVMLGRGRGRAAALAVFALAPIVRGAMHVAFPQSSIRNLPIFPAVADAMAIGCIIAISRDALLKNRWWRLVTKPAMALPLTVTILGISAYSGYTIIDVFGMPIVLVAIAAIVEGSTRWPRGVGFLVLNARPVVWIGTLSYSLYIWQQLFLDRSAPSVLTSFPVNVACAFAVAAFSHYVVERPFLRLRYRFRAFSTTAVGATG